MNDSGKALRGLRAASTDDAIPDLIVLVDDIHTDLGYFRLRASGSPGGHNGLKSVETALGTRNYARLRIGVGPKPAGADQAEWVLDEMPRSERDAVTALVPEMCEAVECWAARGIQRAMTEFNHRPPSPEDA
jgi:PTH1 family peptidyl-tRNA hydrolase